MRSFRRPELYAASFRSEPCASHNGVRRLARAAVRGLSGMAARVPGVFTRSLFQTLRFGIVLLGLALTLAAQGPLDGGLHGSVASNAGLPPDAASLSLVFVETGARRSLPIANDHTFSALHLVPGAYRVELSASGPGHALNLLILPGETTEIVVPASGPPALVRPFSLADVANANPALAHPDQDADGLAEERAVPSIENAALLDGLSLVQAYNSAPAGAGRDPAPDPDGDSDSAETTTGPAHGLSRGRHAGIAYSFAQGSTREFRLATGSYTVQSGHAAGASTEVVTRGGGVAVHGSAFTALRSQALAGAEPLAFATSYQDGVVSGAVVKPHDLGLRFGGTIGGPLGLASLAPGRLFFFAAADAQRRANDAVSSPADPAFYRLTAVQTALLGNRGVTVAETNAALDYVSSLTGTVARRHDQAIEFGRLDWELSPRWTIGLEGNFARWNAPSGLTEAPVVARGRASLGDTLGSIDTLALRVHHGFSAHLANTLRLQVMHDVQYERAAPSLAQEPRIGPGGHAPQVNIGPNGLLFGTPASLAQGAQPEERRLQVGELFTLDQGHHALALGGDYSFVHDAVATALNSAGSFLYDSGSTRGFAGGLVDFITDFTFNVNTVPNGGCPSISAAVHLFCFRSFTQSFGQARAAFATQEFAGFAEDMWRPRAGLALQAGVRYEYTLLPFPVAPNAALDGVFGARGATSVFPEDRTELGPRLSVTWRGLAGVQVRAGYGLYFGRLPGATLRAALTDTALPGSVTRLRLTPATEAVCTAGAAQGFGYPCAFVAPPQGVAAQTASAVVFARHFRLPTVQQGSLTLERGFGRSTSLSAGYVMNLDRQLPGSTDFNLQPATRTVSYQLQGGPRSGQVFAVPLYTARISPAFGPVTGIVSHANGSYNALVAAADTRLGSLTLRGETTWSKALDDAPELTATPRTDSQFDPFANGYDKAISTLNITWSASGTALWRPVLRHSGERLRRLANGWELESVAVARAGRPYSFDISGGSELPGGHLSLNGSGGALYLPTVGRNTLRLPPTVIENLRVARGVKLGRAHGEALVEAFNLFNHRNVSAVNERAYLVGQTAGGLTGLVFQDAAGLAAEGLNGVPFGGATAASAETARARQVQVEVRVAF